jgi:hypothetical protein
MVRDLGKFGTFITTSEDIKFLGLIIENSLTWEGHIEEVIKKLSRACYMIRNIKPFVFINILKMIYYSYFYSVMMYSLIYWGNSSSVDRVCRRQKSTVRLMMGCGHRESCRDLFNELGILPLRLQYIYSLLLFVIKNSEKFVTNKDYHELKIRQDLNLHMHQINLAIFSKGVYHMAVKFYNGLPYTLKTNSSYPKKFKA